MAFWHRRRTQRKLADRARRQRPAYVQVLEPRLMLDSTVVFSELMYHDAGEADTEWVELHNQMSVDIDLSDWSLANGIEYEFPNGSVIPAGGYLVVASDPVTFSAATGLQQVYGPFNGRLANDGETIELRNNSDRRMDVISYGDDAPWPVGPDGSGVTLSKVDRSGDSQLPENWTRSEQLGGTPGRSNFVAANELPRIRRMVVDGNTPASLFVPTTSLVDDAWQSVDYVPGSRGETWLDVSASVGFNRETEAPSYADEVQADSPMLYWRFQDSPAATAVQNSGVLGEAVQANYGLDAGDQQASLVGEPTDSSLQLPTTATAPTVESAGFEKSVTVNNITPTGRTLEFWFTLQSLPNGLASLVSDGESALDAGTMVYLTQDGHIRFYVRTTNAADFGINAIDSSRQLDVGEAVHVVASWDQPTGDMQLYLNGVRDAVSVVSGVVPTSGTARNTNNPVFVGLDRRNSSIASGLIDEVAIYNYALPSDRVAVHHGVGQVSFDTLILHDIEAASYGVSSSAYVRVPFEYSDDLAVDQFTLQAQYNDGFVAYLNGTEIARRNIDSPATYSSAATSQRSVSASLTTEVIDVSSFANQLRAGTNLLAIHALNASANDDNLLLNVSLDIGGVVRPPTETPKVVINELSEANAAEYQVELRNLSDNAIDLAGFVLQLQGTVSQSYTLPSTVLGTGQHLALSAATMGLQPQENDRLYLFTPNQSQLADARRVSGRLQGRTADGQWLYPADPTFGAPNRFDFQQDIVISEIMYHARPQYTNHNGVPYAESREEWIELYNRGSQAVDLSNWEFRDAVQFVFPAGTNLGPGEYLVVANDVSSLVEQRPEIGNRALGNFSGELSNQSDTILLIDAAQNPADVVRYYDGGYWPSSADGGGSSLELRDPWSDNNDASAWTASDETGRSEWQTYSYRGIAEMPRGANFPRTYNEFSFGLLDAGELLIDDIRVIEDPDGAAHNLIQNSDFTSSLDTWRDVGNHHGTVVPDPDNAANAVLRLVANGPEEHLQNHVETTLKFDNSIVAIDLGTEYEIQFRAKWLSGSPQLNTRLFFDILPQTTILAQPLLSGTPGQPNSHGFDNLGPTIDHFSHSPVSPTSGEDVVVRARARSRWSPDGDALVRS